MPLRSSPINQINQYSDNYIETQLHMLYASTDPLTHTTMSIGPVTSLLLWRPLVPLSRLTYGAYLIHSPLYLVRAGILRERFSIQHYHLVSWSFSSWHRISDRSQ